jgi:hypothetical protein
VIVNLEKWDSLSDEAKEILQSVAIQHEIDSVNALRAKRDEDFAALDANGMIRSSNWKARRAPITSPPRDHHVGADARADGGQPRPSSDYDRLIELFYDPAAD